MLSLCQLSQEDATDKVDAGFDDILSLLDFRKQPGEAGAAPKPKMDEYERTVKELNFESRAKPTDRLKTDEELAQEAIQVLLGTSLGFGLGLALGSRLELGLGLGLGS